MRLILVAALALGLGVAVWVAFHPSDPSPSGPAGPVVPKLPSDPGFVSSETCRKCHEDRHETWLKTAHAYSLRAAGEGSVEGRFDGRPIKGPGFLATPFTRGTEHFIRVEGLDGRAGGEHKVSRVVGRTFEQAYLFTGPRGEWRVLPICWSIDRQAWDMTHEVLDDISGHVGAVAATFDTRQTIFNHGCGQCHATDYAVGHDVVKDTYRSTMLEGAVACESCHGPGSIHVAWYEQTDEDAPPRAQLLDPKELDPKQVLESCGRCHYLHEWRYAIDPDPRVGYLDIAVTMNYDRPGFFADGRLKGLNYHGSTQKQSACYLQGGMSCLSCHRMHGGKPWAMKFQGDAQCTQCHSDDRFQTDEHSFHRPVDANCLDCHMPRYATGVLHFMRDHSITKPEPELTELYGADNVPNACNNCHDTQTASWAKEFKEQWWGAAPRRLVEDVGVVMQLRTKAKEVPTATLAALALRHESRLFFRTTAVRELGRRGDERSRAALRKVLFELEPELIQLACEAFGAHADAKAAPALLRLTEHPVRTIRVEAAFALVRAGWRGQSETMERVYQEARKMLLRQREFANLLLRIATIADALGRFQEMENTFVKLVRMGKGRWDTATLELLHRRARNLAEQGNPADALTLYSQVRGLYGEPSPELLFIDSADALAAVGRVQEAAGNWRHVLGNFDRNGTIWAIAQARFAAATRQGDLAKAITHLEQLVPSLESDPAGGEMLRRVRWSLRVLAQR